MLMITAIQLKTAMRIFYISLNTAGKATLVVCIRKLMTSLYAIVISRTLLQDR